MFESRSKNILGGERQLETKNERISFLEDDEIGKKVLKNEEFYFPKKF